MGTKSVQITQCGSSHSRTASAETIATSEEVKSKKKVDDATSGLEHGLFGAHRK